VIKSILRVAFSIVVTAAALSAGPASSRELVYGSWLSPKSTTNTITMTQYLARIAAATKGEITWKHLSGGQVATANGSVDAVKKGIIDAGHAIAPYVPKELAATNLLFNTNSVGDDVVGDAGARVETMMLGCPECLEEYRRNNAVSFVGQSVPPYHLLCRSPIRTVADLKGVKVRSSAGGISIMTIAGATPVAMTVPEGVTAMERGTIECSWAVVNWLKNFGYMDVTKYILDYPLGMAGPPIAFFVNRNVWKSMTPAQRKAHFDNAAFLVATEMLEAQLKLDTEVVVEAKQKGIVFIKGGDDFRAVMDRHYKEQRPRNVATAKEHGVKNPDAILDYFEGAIAKWNRLSKDIGTDKEKFIQALQREIYGKIDPEKL